ncbi:AtzG-like protein [Candidatus Ishikawella capsulata]|nr:AtzG-like protein [Candidatus Ishikawaella capsulata]
MKNQIEYQNYLRQMNKLFNVEVDEKRFSQLVEQFMYIAEIAEPLINFPLENYL